MNTTPLESFRLVAGSVVGRDHSVKRRNCQDAVRSGQVGASVFGVVSDGCGEGAASELGANLSAAIVAETMRRHIASGGPLHSLPEVALEALERAFVALLDETAETGSSVRHFVRDHLLATVVAFVATPRDSVVFAFGDGLILIDRQVVVLCEDNRPSYPAYALLGRPPEPRRFHFGRVDTIGVATDGLDPESLVDLARTKGRDLGRAMRVIQQRGALEDDSAAVIATRVAGESASTSKNGPSPHEGA